MKNEKFTLYTVPSSLQDKGGFCVCQNQVKLVKDLNRSLEQIAVEVLANLRYVMGTRNKSMCYPIAQYDARAL